MQIIELLERYRVPYQSDVSGSKLSYFGSGGNIKCIIEPSNMDEIFAAAELLSPYKYDILGGCTNTLISDKGTDIVLSLNKIKDIFIENNSIVCYAGSKLQSMVALAKLHSLKGVEFLTGIPGTFGGAVYMNAGAFGREIKDVLENIVVLENNKIKKYTPSELGMKYRESLIKNRIVIGGTIQLERSNQGIIDNLLRDYTEYRQKTQPLKRSLGSVFKRVNDVSAAFYIEKTGLKGLNIGGAELSQKHCNFIINKNNAKSADYMSIVKKVQTAVAELGIMLKMENVLVGYE